MRFLITNARFPVPLDWAQRLICDGHQVILADSLYFPIGRFCRGVESYLRLPPLSSGKVYINALLKAFQKLKVDVLLPAYEDIFHLAKHVPWSWLQQYALMPHPELLFTMYSKYAFLEKVKGFGLQLPRTRLITARDQIDLGMKSVLKLEYSNFDTENFDHFDQSVLNQLNISTERSWVQQEFLKGRLFYSYSLAWYGQVVTHANYFSKYILNQVGGNYFVPVENAQVTEFCREFIEKNKWHGQLGFKFIETKKGLYVIECAPCMNSGFHLVYDELDSTQWPPVASCVCAQRPLQYGDALFIFFGWNALKKRKIAHLIDDYRHADDVLCRGSTRLLPRYGIWLSLAESYWRMCKRHVSYPRSFLIDVECGDQH